MIIIGFIIIVLLISIVLLLINLSDLLKEIREILQHPTSPQSLYDINESLRKIGRRAK